MDVDISIGDESITVSSIENPYRYDSSQLMRSIMEFGDKAGIDLAALEVDKLVPLMIRGVAGCEGGCPANAQSLVREGFGEFSLTYIEGGILSAVYSRKNGEPLSVKVFPDFN
jgi:hypothetical protein